MHPTDGKLRSHIRVLRNILLVIVVTMALNPCLGQTVVSKSIQQGQRSLLLCCGLPGDDVHREKMTSAVRSLQSSVQTVFGIASEQQIVLVADEQMQDDLRETFSNNGVCTSASVKTQLDELSKSLSEDDSLLCVFIGHGHLNRNSSQFNVMDSDFDQTSFSDWTQSLKCREQIFILTQPLSGFWIRPLRRPGRVVITATEADLEFNGTEMPYALADVLSGESQHSQLNDIDGDGNISLLDLYIATNLEVDGRFTAMERLQTEHAQLDDNADGRGTELQQPYLPVKITETDAEESEEDGEGGGEDGEESGDNADDSTQEQPAEGSAEKPVGESPPTADTVTPPNIAPADTKPMRPPIIRLENQDGYRSRFIHLVPPPPKEVIAPSDQSETDGS